MSGGSAIALGVVLGLMMCFDLGGPVNKAAYLFATAGNRLPKQRPHSRSWPLSWPPAWSRRGALALATTVRKQLFTEPEIENGRAAWLLGASFISEGAIPFAVQPTRCA